MAKKKIRELKDVEIMAVSLVKSGANGKPFIYAKSEDGKDTISLTAEMFASKSDIKKILYGIVYSPDEIDSQDEYMTAVEIEKSAHRYLEHYRSVDTEHNLFAGAGTVVESYIAPCDMDIEGKEVKKGSWVLAVKATDDAWEQYLAGQITGFSFFGFSHEVNEYEVDVVKKSSFFESVKNSIASFFEMKSVDSVIEERISALMKSPDFIMEAITYACWDDWVKDTKNTAMIDIFLEKLKEGVVFVENLINNINNEEGVISMKQKSEEISAVEDENADTTNNDDSTDEISEETVTEESEQGSVVVEDEKDIIIKQKSDIIKEMEAKIEELEQSVASFKSEPPVPTIKTAGSVVAKKQDYQSIF